MQITTRPGRKTDVAAIRDIYNHYVRETIITFDLHEVSLENRQKWFAQFAPQGRHQIFVAQADTRLIGFAYSAQFRAKAAYDTSIEVTVYTDAAGGRRGVGMALYTALFAALKDEDIHRAYAVITKPNEASERFHARFGFAEIGGLSDVGRKFGSYHTTGYWEKPM